MHLPDQYGRCDEYDERRREDLGRTPVCEVLHEHQTERDRCEERDAAEYVGVLSGCARSVPGDDVYGADQHRKTYRDIDQKQHVPGDEFRKHSSDRGTYRHGQSGTGRHGPQSGTADVLRHLLHHEYGTGGDRHGDRCALDETQHHQGEIIVRQETVEGGEQEDDESIDEERAGSSVLGEFGELQQQ